jgi:hypothetical protein
MSSIPERESPLAVMKQARKKHPTRLMVRFPITSATEPASSKHVPLVKAYTEFGQTRRLSCKLSEAAMAGRPTVRRPLLKDVMKLIPANWATTMMERLLPRIFARP